MLDRLGEKRPRGQPRHRWKGQVKKNLEKREIKWLEMMKEETRKDQYWMEAFVQNLTP